MGLLTKRRIASLAHSDNDFLTSDIPREHMFARLWIRISGNLVVTAAVTLQENGILNLLKNIQIKAEGALVPKNMSGVLAYLRSKYEGRVAPTLSQPATAAGTNAFNASIPIDFILPSDYGRNDRYSTLFDSDIYKTLQIILSSGNVDDVISAGTATLSSVTYAVHTDEITGIANRFTDMNQESQQDKNFSSASTALEHDMPLGNLFRSFAIRAVNNGSQSDTLLNSIQVRMNGNIILADLTWDELLDINKQEYHVESMETGFAILNLDVRRLFAEMVPSKNASSLKLIYNVDAPTSSTGVIEVLPSEIILNPKNVAS
jgi:hypothetical protein